MTDRPQAAERLDSYAWGKRPQILACGHLAEPIAGIGNLDGKRVRECWRCGGWHEVVAEAPDLDVSDG